MNTQAKGVLLTVIAAISWGLSGTSGQYLMAQGVPVNLLSILRLGIAGIVLTIVVLLTDREAFWRLLHNKRDLLQAGLFGIFGLLLNQYAYLQAIHYTNAGTATVLQYVTPVLILIVTCVVARRLPTVAEVFAILFAISGTYIMATHGQFGELAVTPLGLFWGLLSAVTYSLYLLLPTKLIKTYGALPVIGPSMLFAGLVFWLVNWSTPLDLHLTVSTGGAYLGLIGVGTIIAYTLFLRGVSLIGAVKGSLLASIEPVSAVFFSVLIMHDIFYPVDFLGMIFILVGVFLITLKDFLALKRAQKID